MAVSAFFLAVILLVFWILMVFVAWQQTHQRQQSEHLNRALALMPMVLVDIMVRLSGLSEWFAVVGVFHFVPVVIAVLLLHHMDRIMQPESAMPKHATITVVAVTVSAQLPMLFQPVDQSQWISQTPFADIERYWWVYLPYVVSCGAMVMISAKLLDVCRRYHKYLSWQAVDIKRYRCQLMTVAIAILLLLVFLALVLVIATSIGAFALEYWPVMVDGLTAIGLMLVLARSILAHNIVPSPLNYDRLFSKSALGDADALLNRAEKTMISTKSYKVIGLTIGAFCQRAGIDATDFARALRLKRKQDFRAFVFHYRMEYARNVVMRSDASIAAVAKRLGFHSEKFLSGAFLHYLEKRR